MLPKLKKDDYLKQGYEFWKDYRESLTAELNKQETELEKNPENITKKAKEIGIKPTARYFDMSPASVRYYVRKYEDSLK